MMFQSLTVGGVAGLIASYIALLVIAPPEALARWVKENPPADYVWIRNRVRAVRYSRARRRLEEYDLIVWAHNLCESWWADR